MPEVKPNESRNSYMGRCVARVMAEGLTQEQAVGKCEGMYDTATKCVAKALEEKPGEGPFIGRTTFNEGHAHGYAIVPAGNGTTSKTDHLHEIEGCLVVPAADGHTHLLDRIEKGARSEMAEHGMGIEEGVKTAVDHCCEHVNYYEILAAVGL